MVLYLFGMRKPLTWMRVNWKSLNVACEEFRTIVILIGNEPFTCIQCTYITICDSLPPPPQFNVGLDSGLRIRHLPTFNGGGGGGG